MKQFFYVFAATALLMVVIVSCSNSKERVGVVLAEDCNENEHACNSGNERVGIVFTFDDISINEWYEHRDLFQKYTIRATFFISNLHELDSNIISKLKILESDGHEIACHGYEHKNAMDYQDPNDFVNQEVMQALQKLQDIGFEITSFSYPYGSSTSVLDSILLNYFKTIRKATYNKQKTTIDKYPEIYANNSNYRVVNAMGLDHNYKISPENFEIGLKKALKNKEILIVYAHIINTSKENYTVHPDYLEKLFLICKKHHIKPMTMNEMYRYFQK
jgi:peptidoglycan/xylan/chitin deacetylase (PgdA/CDA1 family)